MEIDENNKYWQRIPSYLLNNLIIFNEVFRRVMTNDNIKSRQKTGFQPLFRRYIFQKSTSGWEWNWLPLNWNPFRLRWNTHKITCSCMNLISNQQETIKNYQNFLEKDLKGWKIRLLEWIWNKKWQYKHDKRISIFIPIKFWWS